jgi:hypothetical protein
MEMMRRELRPLEETLKKHPTPQMQREQQWAEMLPQMQRE